MKVVVVGLGKIGLPLAVQFARSGARVTGCDVNPARVEEVNGGVSPFPDEANLAEWLGTVVKSGALNATTNTEASVKEADVAIVIVPLVAAEGGTPDFATIDAAVGAVAAGAHEGLTVCFETTMPVGATRRLGERIAAAAKLSIGETLFVAFSPERVYSGRIFADLMKYPKLVGGVDDASGARAAEFYRAMLPGVEVRVMSNAEVAEMSKLAETAYRDVNIGFANELARYAADRGIDVGEVIEAANSQPFSHIHDPGAGVGGHCIPHYPHFLMSDYPEATIMPAARAVNEGQPAWVVDQLKHRLGTLENKRVLVLGVSYRAGVKEPTSSPGIALIEELNARGAAAHANDPLFTDEEIKALGAIPAPMDPAGFDAIILQATHAEYGDLDWPALTRGTIVVDGRNALDAKARSAIEEAGATYVGIGR